MGYTDLYGKCRFKNPYMDPMIWLKGHKGSNLRVPSLVQWLGYTRKINGVYVI